MSRHEQRRKLAEAGRLAPHVHVGNINLERLPPESPRRQIAEDEREYNRKQAQIETQRKPLTKQLTPVPWSDQGHGLTDASSVLIWFNTSDRPDACLTLLKDIAREAKTVPASVTVRVVNDGSDHAYTEVEKFIEARCWYYRKERKAHGRDGYTRLIADRHQELRQLPRPDYFLKLDDDVELKPGSITEAARLFRGIQDDNKTCLTLLRDNNSDSNGREAWTGWLPATCGPVDRVGWVDGIYLATPAFYETLNWTLPDPAGVGNGFVGSGMGHQQSNAMIEAGRPMFRVNNSLVLHRSESVMRPKAPQIRDVTTIGNRVVTVLVAAYQAEKWLEESVNSILTQNLPSGWQLEVLIGVDGCPRTLLAARRIKDERVGIISFEDNRGPYITCDSLLPYSSGSLVVRQDADDIAVQNRLNVMIKSMEDNPDLGLVATCFEEVDKDLKLIKHYDFAPDGVWMWRKSVWDSKIGAYEPWLCGADSDALFRAQYLGIKSLLIPQRLYLRREHPQQLTRKQDTGFQSAPRKRAKVLIQRKRLEHGRGILPSVVTPVLREGKLEGELFGPVLSSSPVQKEIGIIALADPMKGLLRDAEIVVWALNEPSFADGPTPGISIFGIPQRDEDDSNLEACNPKLFGDSPLRDYAVKQGTSITEWVDNKKLEVVLAFEIPMPHVFSDLLQRGISPVLMVNLDCISIKELENLPEGVILWTKTPEGRNRLEELGFSSQLIPWSIPDPVVRDRKPSKRSPVKFLFNGGTGGYQSRRGTDIVIQAFKKAVAVNPKIKLTIKTILPLRTIYPNWKPSKGIASIEGLIPREELSNLYDDCDAVVYPSRWEGFGLSLLESLHRGCPVLATDGWPMNEMVTEGHNGILIESRQVGERHSAPHWEPSIDSLVEVMLRFASERRLRERITCPDPSELVSKQNAFVSAIHKAMLGAVTSVLLIADSEAKQGQVPSQVLWAEALTQQGVEVFVLPPNQLQTSRGERVLQKQWDFVLTGKLSIPLLHHIKERTPAPLVSWHHDWIDFHPSRQKWSREISSIVDLYLIPSDDGKDGGQYLLPSGEPTSRPSFRVKPSLDSFMVFLGQAYSNGRLRFCENLYRQDKLTIYGHDRDWKAMGVQARKPVYQKEMSDILWNARYALSVSAIQELQGYTSSRLFMAAAAGACVVVKDFPGLDKLFPKDALVTFGEEDSTSLLRRLQKLTPSHTQKLRTNIERHFWNHHTWRDRVQELLRKVRSIRLEKGEAMTPATKRVRKLEIGTQRAHAAPVKGQRIAGVEPDFETLDVMEGADHCGVWGDGPLPFPDNTFSEVYASHVLEHIPWFNTVDALKEAHRILVPGGLIEVWTPNAEWIMRQWLDGQCGDNWRKDNPNNDPTLWAAGRLMAYGPGEENWHRALISPGHLAACMRQSGFVEVTFKKHRTRHEAAHGPVDLGMTGVKPGASNYDERSCWDERYKGGGFSGKGSRGEEAQWKLDLIFEWLTKTGASSIIDFGCGDGHLAFRILERFPLIRYIGLDISATVIEANKLQALQKGLANRATFKTFDISTPWQGEPADCAICMDVLFHIKQLTSFQQVEQNIHNAAGKVALYSNLNETARDEAKAAHVFYRPSQLPCTESHVVPVTPNKTFYVHQR